MKIPTKIIEKSKEIKQEATKYAESVVKPLVEEMREGILPSDLISTNLQINHRLLCQSSRHIDYNDRYNHFSLRGCSLDREALTQFFEEQRKNDSRYSQRYDSCESALFFWNQIPALVLETVNNILRGLSIKPFKSGKKQDPQIQDKLDDLLNMYDLQLRRSGFKQDYLLSVQNHSSFYIHQSSNSSDVAKFLEHILSPGNIRPDYRSIFPRFFHGLIGSLSYKDIVEATRSDTPNLQEFANECYRGVEI